MTREREMNTLQDTENGTQIRELDAGALFVLKSKGSWWHCGYHLTTSITTPSLLSLPYAFAFLGWGAGLACLVITAVVTFYSYNLLSLVLEQQAEIGHRQLRFREMAHDILGPNWGRYFVGTIQFLLCYGVVIGCPILGGQSMKSGVSTSRPLRFFVEELHWAIYVLLKPEGTMKLYDFVIIFGIILLILAQIPSFHSLRHINLVSLLLCLGFSAAATYGSIQIGRSSNAHVKDYSIVDDTKNRAFGMFNAIAIIATTFGNGIIPEIQATLAPPVKGKMLKGLTLCYAVISVTFLSVTISGYWAFGNQSAGQILSNFIDSAGNPRLPKWFIIMSNSFVMLQLAAVGVVYLQPTNEVLEKMLCDANQKQYSARNVIPRVISRSLSVVITTTIAAMLPFFGDVNAVIGALGFMPLDFVLPVVFYNLTFKPSKRSVLFWVNVAVAVVFTALGLVASVAAVRQIVLDAKTYKLFADV